jgi:hypothetical protein
MIGAGIHGPAVRPFYNHGAAAPETIFKRGGFWAASAFTPPVFLTLTVPNVPAVAGDVLVCSCSFNANAGQILSSVDYGGDSVADDIGTVYGSVVDHEADIATIPVTVSGINNVIFTLDGNTTSMVAVVTVWAGLLNATFDKFALSQVPPGLPGNPADSGLTPATTQAHELVVGAMGEILALELAGAWQAPMVGVGDAGTGSVPHPDQIKTGAYIVHAIGQQRAKYVGHTVADWAALCGTLKGA